MKILLAVIIISLSFICNNSFAVGKEYILKSKCKNEKEAQSCTECVALGKASFKIDKSLASVLMIYKLDTGESDSILHENCKIFDSETFVCELKDEDDINLGTFKLTNGI